MVFTEGMEVQYKNLHGIVNFVCDDYITVLVRRGVHKSKDVNALVYSKFFKEVLILGEK